MRNINLNIISDNLKSKDARLVATAAFKWFVNGHINFLRDYDMIKATVQDYLDLMKIAQFIDDLDTFEHTPAMVKTQTGKIARMIWNLDTIVRDQIPETVYGRFNN